jgi:hypothetical protein
MSMITFTDGKALICSMPSTSQNGVYLVRVEPTGNHIVVSHDCPACHFGNKKCKHVQMAVQAYERWQWWEPKKRVQSITRKIVLTADWEQIQLPPSPEEQLQEVIRYVT